MLNKELQKLFDTCIQQIENLTPSECNKLRADYEEFVSKHNSSTPYFELSPCMDDLNAKHYCIKTYYSRINLKEELLSGAFNEIYENHNLAFETSFSCTFKVEIRNESTNTVTMRKNLVA